MESADYWIQNLKLEPHPEGGYFRETYRTRDSIPEHCLDDRYRGDRAFATAIYFLLTADSPSHLHRLKSDEFWFFHAGSGATITLIREAGTVHRINLGPDPARNQGLQLIIPGGTWFGAEVDEPGGYTLVSCMVAPGFDYADFEMATRPGMLKAFPHHRDVIERLTPGETTS